MMSDNHSGCTLGYGKNQIAIVLAAFGASSATARCAYGHIEEVVRRHLPDYEVFQAFLSRRVVARLRDEGISVPSLDDLEEQLRAGGYKAAVLLPLLTVPGQEYAQVRSQIFNGIQIVCCGPLLSGEHDIDDVLGALQGEFRAAAVNVLVCHGNRKHDEYNDLLAALSQRLAADYDNCLAASVEGRPGKMPLQRARKMAQCLGHAHFVPFMMVAGEHITKDVMGDDPGSWKNEVGACETTCAHSLGWNEDILRLFLHRLDEGLAQLQKELR